MERNNNTVEIHEDDKHSIVRSNMIEDVTYRPYCGNGLLNSSRCSAPRVTWDNKLDQMVCPECGWISTYPTSFIQRYKDTHGLP